MNTYKIEEKKLERSLLEKDLAIEAMTRFLADLQGTVNLLET